MECWKDNVELVYDEATRTTGNKPGVEIRTKDFGNTTSIEWLDAGRDDYAVYFGPIVDHLVETMGYVRGISIHGAPYDFRKAPSKSVNLFLAHQTVITRKRLQIIWICNFSSCLVLLLSSCND